MSPISILKEVRKETNEVLLFHSANGKDSITLLDMCYSIFSRVICVYLYTVPELTHINRFIQLQESKYPGVRFIQYPHFALGGYEKIGYLGCKKNEKTKKETLASITEKARKATGIEWAVFGFKKSDSLNRRLMLMTYEFEAINRKTKKVYPLSAWKNGDVLKYIELKKLPAPTKYGSGQSQGVAVNDIDFLLWCKRKCPQDYQQILKYFPEAGAIVYEHEYHNAVK